jgi:hypothetical protein
MVQATDFGDLHDPSPLGELDWSGIRRILVEREVRATLMIVLDIAGQNAAEVSFAQDKNVIQTLAADRTDQALGERILPGAVRRRENFVDAHALHAVAKLLAIDLVTVAQEIGGRGVAMVDKDDEDEEHAQAHGGYGEESMDTRSWRWLARNVRQV